jgi:hypothetical protein
MPMIFGGKVIEPQTTNPGLKQRLYHTEGVPTDATIGVAAVNGMLAENVLTGFVYERQAGAWVRIDTI